jgi:hypothetical protein
MNHTTSFFRRLILPFSIAAVLFLGAVVAAPPSYGHGGKSHAVEEFTALDALEKATELYGRLLATGKLKTGWETGLSRVEISRLENKGHRAFGISFHRSEGEPATVHIFLKADGSYAGSNFTGE